jgi:site-specific DNA-methyltransferase (adenine-specific)
VGGIKIEQIGDCTLYLGDCMDVMPKLGEVDAVVTDPPYGLGDATGTISKKRSHKREYESFDDSHENLINKIIPAFETALSIAGRAVVTTGGKHAFHYPKPSTLGCIYQPAGCGMCEWGRLTTQPVLFYGRDPLIGKTIKNISYTTTQKASDDRHPCAKPIGVTEWMVDRASVFGEVVLDPFMGSGTTGVACVNLGRKFIGIEIEQKYFDIACQRIQDAVNQPRLFSEEAPIPEQEELLYGN